MTKCKTQRHSHGNVHAKNTVIECHKKYKNNGKRAKREQQILQSCGDSAVGQGNAQHSENIENEADYRSGTDREKKYYRLVLQTDTHGII